MAQERDVGTALEQRPALALGHPAPDAELGAVVEGVGQALGDDRAALADDLGGLLGRALDEEGVGVRLRAPPQRRPVLDPVDSEGHRAGGACGRDGHCCPPGKRFRTPIPAGAYVRIGHERR